MTAQRVQQRETLERYGSSVREHRVMLTPTCNAGTRVSSALPSVGDLVQDLAAESLGGARDRAAAKVAVEIDRDLVVGQRPDHQAVHAALSEIAPRRLKQLAAKAKTLKFGSQIKLINLAVVIQAARAIATVIGIARDCVAE